MPNNARLRLQLGWRPACARAGVADAAAALLALADDCGLAHLRAVALDFIVTHYDAVSKTGAQRGCMSCAGGVKPEGKEQSWGRGGFNVACGPHPVGGCAFVGHSFGDGMHGLAAPGLAVAA